MKQPGTILRHDDRDYLCVEGGYNPETRAVIVLARPGDPTFPPAPAARPIRWGAQGDWFPVARWSPSELRIPDERHAPRRELIAAVVDGYVRRAPGKPVVAWAARKGGALVATLETALPMGLAAACCDEREAAAALPGAEQVVPVDNVGMFLTHLVREGYAGVMWNAAQPVFFCADETGDLQFLRVSAAARAARGRVADLRDPDEVRLELLDESGRWEPYDGAEEIEFIDNRDACDERLVETLGRTPVVDWPDGAPLWSIGPSAGAPAVVRDTQGADEVRHALLFSSEDAARAWVDDDASGMQVFAVPDLTGFLTCDALQGNVAALNPGGHRARSGILWSDGERVVLDSFSGFWQLARDGFLPLGDEDGA